MEECLAKLVDSCRGLPVVGMNIDWIGADTRNRKKPKPGCEKT